jgi:lipopolysaccharide export LptBFGC system permease protein LptF
MKIYKLSVIKSFIISIVTFFLIFFFFIYSTNFVTTKSGNIPFFDRILVSFCFSFYKIVVDLPDVVVLIASTIYFMTIKRNFDFNVIQSFGVDFLKIIKPIILFLTLCAFGILIFINPFATKLYNYGTKILSEKKSQTVRLDVIDSYNNLKYIISFDTKISSNINKESEENKQISDAINFKNIIITEYFNKDISRIIQAKSGIIEIKGLWHLSEVNVINSKNNKLEYFKTLNITGSVRPKEITAKARSQIMSNAGQILTLYDKISLVRYFSLQRTENIQATEVTKFKVDVFLNIAIVFNIISSFLVAAIFRSNNSREHSYMKNITKSLLFFLSTRYISSLVYTTALKSYNLGPILVLIAPFVIMSLCFLFIYNKEYCHR